MSLEIKKMSPIGAQIIDPDVDYLLTSSSAPDEIMDALEENSVLLLRGLHLDDATQLAIATRLGEIVVRHSPGWSEQYPGIYKIGLDPESNSELYVKGSWDWHIDGATQNGIPPKASLLTCRTAAANGGETQFVSTYAAYDRLNDEEKDRFEGIKVWHKVRADAYSVPIHMEQEDYERLEAEPSQLQPLVWTHHNGRKSLVLGVTAWTVEGMDDVEGIALLKELLDRATEAPHVFTHTWEVDDLVMWDNRGTMHRARPYEGESGRDMHRITLVGDEPIQ
jgi:alpha-ketoglutarate-dependent taurine dioxygenase